MKTHFFKNSLLAITLSLGMGQAMASENKPVKTDLHEVSKTIGQSVRLPEEFRKPGLNARLTVFFSVDETGHVNQVMANTNAFALKQAVETQFVKLQLTGLTANTVYSIVLNFKTL
ncbi:MAG: hypothetical protein JST26_20465 [Bacteroidetes bacterium]|nr:hypothetical protein [Bacteroidota bacterium]